MTKRYKDQTVGPPWHYDAKHKQVYGRKHSTGGSITVAIINLTECNDEGDPLYYPMPEQANVLGYLIADLLNMHMVRVRDWRFVPVSLANMKLRHLVQFDTQAKVQPSLYWWQDEVEAK